MTVKPDKADLDLDGDAVEDFLRHHADFFIDRDALLLQMELPHQQNGTVSLIEKQISLLRERNREVKNNLEQYMLEAKSNEAILNRCHRLILALIEATDSDSFFSALEHSFRNDFKCSAYSLIAFNDKAQQVNHFTSAVSESAAREYIGGLMRSTKPTLGVLRPAEQDFLFRHQSTRVKSAAVISIKRDQKQMALLSIGSNDPDYFQTGMGTLFIRLIADILSRLLPRYIDLGNV